MQPNVLLLALAESLRPPFHSFLAETQSLKQELTLIIFKLHLLSEFGEPFCRQALARAEITFFT